MNFFSFVFIVGGFIPQITISQDSTYCIGDVFDVTWDATLIHPNDVDIVLTWGTNSSWTVATKQPNNGSAAIGGDLGNSANQLSIQNGTIGTFYAVENATSNLTANVVTLCQSIIFGTSGRAVQPGDRIDNIVINLRESTYNDMGGDTADWVANFVTVDETKMEWTVAEPLVVPESTPSPTTAPTETTTTTTTTTTTQPPQPGQPTQFFSTASPENKNNDNSISSGGLSLAEALRKVSLGSEDASVQIVSDDCGRPVETEWCTVTLSVKIPDDAKIGGTFDLAIGVLPANSTDTLQYYGVNTNDDNSLLTTQFITYNSSLVDISWDFSEARNNNTIYKYERVPMKITLDDDSLNSNLPLYVVAVNDRYDLEYLLECGMSATAEDYEAFGWKTIIEDSRDVDLLQGSYHFEMYWAVDSDYNNVLPKDEYFQLGDSLMEFVVRGDKNGTVEPPVEIKDKKTKFERNTKSQSVSFETSFNGGTVFNGYITQCNVTCKYIGNSTFNFTTEQDGTGKADILFSKTNMIDSSFSDNTTTTMHITTILCDGETVLNTSIPIEIGKVGGGGNNGLSAGAIVGIVCAGVLVLGLAAWWLCMKKSGSDGYRELNE